MLLDGVKKMLNITGDAMDDTLDLYIQEVTQFAIGAGVPSAFFETQECVGLVARGVSDLYNLNGGTARLSEYRAKNREGTRRI
jgi:hypothetical protein